MSRLSWNLEGDNVKTLLKNVSKYPSNLQYSFEQTAKEIEASTGFPCKSITVSAVYYNKIKRNIPVVVAVGSNNGVALGNTKNTIRRKPEDTLKVQVALKAFNTMTITEKREFFNQIIL